MEQNNPINTRHCKRRILTLLTSCFVASQVVSAASAAGYRDIEYATVGRHRLLLDLYQPTTRPAPLIIWIHGGAWRSGSKDHVPATRFVKAGFAVASIDYRLSPIARFPAQIHDIKAAIRFLRANADTYNLNTQRFIIAGASAGGHLAALTGVTNGVTDLEGTIGRYTDRSSDVHGIVSFFGAANLQTILTQSTPHGLSVRVPALKLLLGGLPAEQQALARLASPVAHVEISDPPLLLIHGDKDPQMPIQQSYELQRLYEQHKLKVDFEVVCGGRHGGPGFFEDAMLDRVAEYLETGDWSAAAK